MRSKNRDILTNNVYRVQSQMKCPNSIRGELRRRLGLILMINEVAAYKKFEKSYPWGRLIIDSTIWVNGFIFTRVAMIYSLGMHSYSYILQPTTSCIFFGWKLPTLSSPDFRSTNWKNLLQSIENRIPHYGRWANLSSQIMEFSYSQNNYTTVLGEEYH